MTRGSSFKLLTFKNVNNYAIDGKDLSKRDMFFWEKISVFKKIMIPYRVGEIL